MRPPLLLPALLALVACGGCGEDAPPPAPETAPTTVALPEPREYGVVLRGPRPWNDTLYAAVGTFDAADPFEGRILDAFGRFTLVGRPGETFLVRSETQPIAAEDEILWQVRHEGVLGEAEAFEIHAPQRALLRAHAPADSPGPDQLTVVCEDTGAASTVIRDPAVSLFLCVFDAEASHNWRNICPPRPFVWEEWAPGPCVVAGRTAGRQWTARRVDLSPGARVDLDLGAQPRGGGTVICETSAAVLRLGGDLPVPSPRINSIQHYRARWEGVPPGDHVVRYPDGHDATITVVDGETVRLPKR